MLNHVSLVGRITKDLKIKVNDKGVEFALITVAIPKSYKNGDGQYDTDFIPCFAWKAVAKNACNYCKKGDLIGIDGNLTSNDNKIFINVDRVTFLSKKKED